MVTARSPRKSSIGIAEDAEYDADVLITCRKGRWQVELQVPAHLANAMQYGRCVPFNALFLYSQTVEPFRDATILLVQQ
jgi:hypothetical protein